MKSLLPMIMVPGSGSLWRCLSHEGRALMNEIRALIKMTHLLFSHVILQGEDSHLLTAKQALSEPQTCFPVSRTNKYLQNKYSLLRNPVYGIFVIIAQKA